MILLTLASANALFITVYVCYLMFGAALLGACRKDLLSPPGLFTIACLFAFGLSLPLIYRGNRYIETSDYTSFLVTDESLFKVLVIVCVAQAAFVLGYYLNLLGFVPAKRMLSAATPTRRASVANYLLVAALVIVAGAIRIKLHLGEAGVQPTVGYAGYLQYSLFDGVLLCCAWYLAQGLRQSRLYVLLGLSLLVMMAVAQALLGWRGGIAQVGWIMLGLFWYQGKNAYSLVWLMVLPLVAGSIVEIGNTIRSERLGGDKVFAASSGELIEKIAYRSQGTTRLALVAEKFGPLTLFNNFLIKDIIAEGVTTTKYVDRKFYAVAARQSHSVGTSGPGGPYVAMGLFGVMIAYMLLGALFRCIYVCVVDDDERSGNIVATVLYCYLIFLLSSLLSENFDIAFVKNMAAVAGFIFILRILIYRGTGSHAGNQHLKPSPTSIPPVVRARIEL
ncbi:MAG TPA: hypothetical protein VGI32_03040 [Steroidobacteraceae bacterium]